MQPLNGIRVVTLAELYPGPLATLVLADLGADVLFVERPGGDATRAMPGHFEALNRGKRSLVLDLKTPEGRARLHELARDADVVLEGYRPGVAARLGADAATLRAANPRLVHVSVSAFGQTGPEAGRGAHDLTVRALAGLAFAEDRDGVADGEPGPPPLADIAAGMWCAIGVLAALRERDRTGVGAALDVAMLDALLAWRTTELTAVLNGVPPINYPREPAYAVLPARDGTAISLSIAGEDHQWRELCAVLGMDDVADLDAAARGERFDSLRRRIAGAVAERDAAGLVDELADRGVAAGLVPDPMRVLETPQARAREVVVTDPGGARRAMRHPVLYDGRPLPLRAPAPALGADG
jgi:crotonobetainyl-CoA:carnitine CoA-transferase CaiB-like acyl-CoA transferase